MKRPSRPGTWLLSTQIILFVVFAISNSMLFAQQYTNRTFTVKEVEALMAKAETGSNVGFESCTIRHLSSDQTPTGFPSFNLSIPAHINNVLFNGCTFDRVVLEMPEAADLWIDDCEGIERLELGSGNVRVSGKSRIRWIRSDSATNVRLHVENSEIEEISLVQSKIEMLLLRGNNIQNLVINGCTARAHSYTLTSAFFHGLYDYQTITYRGDSVLHQPRFNEQGHLKGWDDYRYAPARYIYQGYNFSGILLDATTFDGIRIMNSEFYHDSTSVFPFYSCTADLVAIRGSRLGRLDLYGSTINSVLEIASTKIEGINLYKASIETTNIPGLTFNLISPNKVYLFNPAQFSRFVSHVKGRSGSDSLLLIDKGYQRNDPTFHEPNLDTIYLGAIQPYTIRTDDDLRQHDFFVEFTNNYAQLYKIYKEREDIESANAAYAEMKDHYTRQAKVRFGDDPSFTSFFRWQLSNMVGFYTRHGTDPARAITISFWTILIFAIFYFFFPSDWDVTSKQKLFQNYRDFVQKNEKGYVKPFFTLLAGITLSFINALTLSVNAYTTLGFGNIPTHGIARYACVFQGFIGWFMLSIFSVALINQVLF